MIVLAAALVLLALQEPPKVNARPSLFTLDSATLAANRERIRNWDPELSPVFDRLIKEADESLEQIPLSVMDKTGIPPSGDKHDYMSVGPYWWPDPTKPGGLPYIRRDGERNPESDGAKSDAPRWGRITAAVETLSLAYFFTGTEAYARHAVKLLRCWFIDFATRMNPNLNFGQGVPGRTEGRGAGIIESRRLTSVIDSIGLMQSSPFWSDSDAKSMRAWMRDYLKWLQTSKNGLEEKRATNNHGTFYDVHVVTLALFTGQDSLARNVLELAKSSRIASQIRPDGSQPREIGRTRSFSYSVFNLRAFMELARLGEHAGVNLWSYVPRTGGGIRRALDYLAPYADSARMWPHRQITPVDRAALLAPLLTGYAKYGDEKYTSLIAMLPRESTESARIRLMTSVTLRPR